MKLYTSPIIHEDECLSSWVTRVARDNLCDPYLFSKKYLQGNIWRKDIDKHININYLNRLSELTRCDIELILGARISQYTFFEVVNTPISIKEMSLLNASVIGERKTSKWMQYCTLCLKESPYLRKHWRFAHVTICHKHRVKLYDACYFCSEPLNFHRLDVRFGSKIHCDKCMSLLENSPVIPVNIESLLSFTESYQYSHINQWFKWKQFDLHTLVLLKGIYFLLKGIRKFIFFPKLKTPISSAPFTNFDIETRFSLMIILSTILSDWPNYLNELKKDNYLTQSSFMRERHSNWPFWLHKVLRLQLSEEHYHPTFDEVNFAICMLIQKGYMPSNANIGEALGKDRSYKIPPKYLKSIHKYNLKPDLLRIFKW